MTQRQAYSVCFIIVLIILGTGIYLEYFDGVMPCPLCTLQRICFAALGLIFLLGIFLYQNRIIRAVINLSSMLFAGLGVFLAGRQIWIQYYPNPENSECGVSLNYMLSVLPITDVAQKIFSGSAECTQRGWEFLTLNIPEWSLIFFALFLLISTFYLFTDYKGRR